MWNKKGAELMVEIAISVVLLTIIMLSLLFINNRAIVNVHAEIEAENANMVCNMNLLNFLKFKDDTGKTFEQLLEESLIKDDPNIFAGPAKIKLDDQLGTTWNMHIYSGTPLRYSPGEVNEDGLSGYFKTNIAEANSCSGDSDCPGGFVCSGDFGFCEFKSKEICSAFLPIPCDVSDPNSCTILLEMEVQYAISQ